MNTIKKRNENGKHVIIIGAGVGGSALAARLAHKGYRVSVYEKGEEVGGRCSLIKTKDHRWDVGPSLYLMPELFEMFFNSLGLNIKDYIQLERCEPSYKVHFSPTLSTSKSGSNFLQPPLELSTSLPSMGIQLDRYEKLAGNPDGLGSFLNFISEAGENYEESVKHVLLRDWNSLFHALTQWDMYPMLIRTKALRIWSTSWKRACFYFKSDQIRRAMTFSSMYMGMSPFDAPATYTLLQYAEYAKGVFYPIGGFQTLVSSFEKVANEFGAKFHFNSNVKRILIDEKQRNIVHGIELEDGKKVYADAVVSNADLIWTYNTLLPSSNYAKRLQNKKQTCSSISFYWGLSEIVPEFGIHNIFLAEQYRESFDEIFQDGQVPGEPSFYVNVPSRVDPSAAPNGGDTLVILIPCGSIATKDAPKDYQNKASFEKIKSEVRKKVLKIIQIRIGKDISNLIREEYIMDPWDWREKYNLWNGSILGLSHCVSQVLWFRPSNQHATLKNMFFVGASAMPGTGVPVVCAGSGIVADRIDAFFNKPDTNVSKSIFTMFNLMIVLTLSTLILALISQNKL